MLRVVYTNKLEHYHFHMMGIMRSYVNTTIRVK